MQDYLDGSSWLGGINGEGGGLGGGDATAWLERDLQTHILSSLCRIFKINLTPN